MSPGRWWVRNLLGNGHEQQLLWCFTLGVKLVVPFQDQSGERGPLGAFLGSPLASQMLKNHLHWEPQHRPARGGLWCCQERRELGGTASCSSCIAFCRNPSLSSMKAWRDGRCVAGRAGPQHSGWWGRSCQKRSLTSPKSVRVLLNSRIRV